MSAHLVVLGAGQAAVQAVQSARRSDFGGAITLVGDEPQKPYQRPPLSKKYLAGELEEDRLAIRPAKFFADAEVALELGVRAEAIEPSARRVRLDDGRRLDYDFLLLATGARARRLVVPGADLEGVHHLRTLADAAGIKRRLREARRAVVVGGGYIGLEVAAVCRGLGAEVAVLEAADRILGRVVCAETAAFFAERHAREGVEIHCNAIVTEIRGQGGVSSVATADGRAFDCDVVIVGIGIEPNDALARAAGLPCDNGIVVDAHAQTPEPRIAAAGDCTNQPHPWVGARIRLESVHNAIEQAKAAAQSLVGSPSTFADVPWFWSDQYDVKLQIAGVSGGHETNVVRGDPATGQFAVYYLSDGLPVAVDAINSPREFLFAKKMLAARARIPPDAIANADADLGRYLA